MFESKSLEKEKLKGGRLLMQIYQYLGETVTLTFKPAEKGASKSEVYLFAVSSQWKNYGYSPQENITWRLSSALGPSAEIEWKNE